MDRALIVGIEQYETASALQGPSLDALRFALWLCRSEKVAAKDIILIHNKCDAWKDDQAGEQEYQRTWKDVLDTGIAPRETPSRAEIVRSWLEELVGGPPEKGTLWIYWSGHGVAFPGGRDALLCAKQEAGDPAFIYLDEFRDSLRSVVFARFPRQRLIVDACREYLEPADLAMKATRQPSSWRFAEPIDQVEFSAVAMGRRAQVGKGSSLFSRILLDKLRETGWPDNPEKVVAFYQSLSKAVAAEAGEKKRPKLRILSPFFEDGFGTGSHTEERDKILQVLGKCHIAFDRYRPLYLQTMSGLTANAGVRGASTLTAMIDELLQLTREELYGGRSQGLVEFLYRAVREFRDDAAPIAKWLLTLPDGARTTIEERLDKEDADLILIVLLQETRGNPHGFPASMQAYLTDKKFAGTRKSWGVSKIVDLEKLEQTARKIFLEAGDQARHTKGANLTIQIFANSPMLGVPWQSFLVDPYDEIGPTVFGELYSFVLRSRARLLGQDPNQEVDSWHSKSEALRARAGREIEFATAPPYSTEVKDVLAKVDGLLFICEFLGSSSGPDSNAHKLLSIAIRKGLPLACWGVAPPRDPDCGKGCDWESRQTDIRTLFDALPSLFDSPVHFRNARKSKPWARETALFWDDDQWSDKLLTLLPEEPNQI